MKIDIVLVHGFGNQRSAERFSHLIKRIKKELPQSNIIPVDYLEKYPSSENITKIFYGRKGLSEMAKICLREIESKRKHSKLIIIGTSLGGLVTRVLVEKMEVNAAAVILAGAPNDGVNLKMQEKIGLIFSKKKWINEIKEGNTFMNKMNEELKTKNLSTKYYLLAGLQDKRVPKKSALALHAFKTIEVDTTHWEIIPQPKSNPNASGKVFDMIMEWIQEAAH